MKRLLLLVSLLISTAAAGSNVCTGDVFTEIQDCLDQIKSLVATNTNVPQGLVALFGDTIVGTRLDDIAINFQYSIPSGEEVNVTLVETGTVLNEMSLAKLKTGTAATGAAIMESKQALRYRPGHEGYTYFTGCWVDTTLTSSQFIGLFDDEDGFAVGFTGTQFGILYRNDSIDEFIPQASFNIDPINGTGASGFDLDPFTLNIFRIGYGWLGTAPVTFDVLDENGNIIPFHRIRRPNMFTIPLVANPLLPIRASVEKFGGSEELIIKTGSWNAGIIGQPSTAASRFFSDSRLREGALVSATENHMISLRNKTTFHSKPNKVRVLIKFTSYTSANISQTVLARIRINADVSGLTFTDFNALSSVIEVSKDNSTTVTGGSLALTSLIPRDDTTQVDVNSAGIQLDILPGETLSVTVEASSSGPSGTEIAVSLAWEELF